MKARWNVLVVSCRIENRRALLDVLESLPVDVFVATTIEQAQEVLCSYAVRVIFCEERVSDGTYRDILPGYMGPYSETRLVVMLCTGEWEEYQEALRLGAAEVIRCPFQATDVELALIHASHDESEDADADGRIADGGESRKNRLSASA